MKQVKNEKYLGDQISGSLKDSTAATVKKRLGVANHAIYEIRSVIEDVRADTVGGMTVAFEIWQMSVLPMLLHNSEVWGELPDVTLKQLTQLQHNFYRVCLAVGKGCPIPSLYWMTGGWLIENRILHRKLLFLHHLATLPHTNLAREIYDAQVASSLPGLATELKPILAEWGVSQLQSYTKLKWKRFMKLKLIEKNRNDLLEMIKNYN